MINILRKPDDIKIICDGNKMDSTVCLELKDRQLDIYLKAITDKHQFVFLRWNYRTDEPVRVLGDKRERAYFDLGWGSINPDKFMPWYFVLMMMDLIK